MTKIDQDWCILINANWLMELTVSKYSAQQKGQITQSLNVWAKFFWPMYYQGSFQYVWGTLKETHWSKKYLLGSIGKKLFDPSSPPSTYFLRALYVADWWFPDVCTLPQWWAEVHISHRVIVVVFYGKKWNGFGFIWIHMDFCVWKKIDSRIPSFLKKCIRIPVFLMYSY